MPAFFYLKIRANINSLLGALLKRAEKYPQNLIQVMLAQGNRLTVFL